MDLREGADVVVVGGGTAGLVAAIAAARTGAKTILIEENGFVGGMAASGLVLLAFYDNREVQIVKGIPWELVTRLIDMEAAVHLRNREEGTLLGRGPLYTARRIVVHPEAVKYIAGEMLHEAGVKLLLRTRFSDVLTERSRLCGVIVENKSGHQAIPAGCVVDCTGDGDVAARAGAPFEKGRPGDGITQPMTMLFMLGNADLARAERAGAALYRKQEVIGSEYWRSHYRSYYITLTPWKVALEREFGEVAERISPFQLADFGHGACYCGNLIHIPGLDASDADQLSEAEIAGRKLIWRLAKFLRDNIPGFEHAHVITTAVQIGVRESRRIVGEYYLTYNDVIEARQFEDQIALSGYCVDVHDHSGKVSFHLPSAGTQVRGDGVYGIPYRCLVPQKIDSLLVAGRCLSASHEAQASARVMGTCMAMGHAAGTAAALALSAGTTVRKLDTQVLKKTLLSQNAVLNV